MQATMRFGLSAILTIMLTVPVMAGQPGTLKWAFPTGGKVSSSPALGKDGTIYVGSENGKVYAINPDGSKKWEFATEEPVSDSPVINARGIIHISSADGKLYALKPDGTLKWFVEPGEGNSSLSRNQTIYLRVGWSLYAVNQAGKKTLLQHLGEIFGAPAIGPDGMVYLSGWQNIYALNPDGSDKWNFNKPYNKFFCPPVVGRNGIIYASGNYQEYIYAIDPSGSQKWACYTTNWGCSSPVIGMDGTIYAHTIEPSGVFAINPDGSKKWYFSKGESEFYGFFTATTPVLGADGTIYFTMKSGLLALTSEGEEKWGFEIGALVYSSPVLAPDGTVYVGSDDGNLYAVYSDSPGLADSDWPMYQHDPQHTGSAQPPYLRPNLSPVIMLLQD